MPARNDVFASFLKPVKDLIHIYDGIETNEKIIENIDRNISFRGANFWLLVFAIFIASIGLNINSIPVIIGAMLISPLMGPIVGLGLSLGISDSGMLRRAIKNLAVATAFGIAVSTSYFLLSPLGGVQSELLARTSPTIYDVLIALFGGFAGVVGSTRKEKGNVIPGMAIATALMPPLCTVGYGVAVGSPHFILGAFYLYVINCIFICLATLFVVKYLKLPRVEYVQPEQARRTGRIITAVVIIIVLPAVYLAFGFVQENKFNQNAERFLLEKFTNRGHVIIYKKVQYRQKPPVIELAFLSKRFSAEEIVALETELPGFELAGARLIVRQGEAALTEEQWNSAIARIQDESERIKAIEAKVSGGFVSSDAAAQILNEAKVINSKVAGVSVGNMAVAESTAEAGAAEQGEAALLVALISVAPGEELTEEERLLLVDWMRLRMQDKTTVVHFLTAPEIPQEQEESDVEA